MNAQTRTVAIVFGLLLAVTLGGIVTHQLTGYDYPSTATTSYELNVLGDIYEAFVLLPVGILALWGLRRGAAWAPVVVAAATIHFAYNYAMAVTGRQNLWIFLWIAKVSLAGVTMCLVWPLLPSGAGVARRSRWIVAGYLLVVVLAFTGLMGQRLLASATGKAVDMTMREIGTLDWGEPRLRDPVVFFAIALPVMIAGIAGFPKGSQWGGRASATSCALAVGMVSVILFSGPLMELLQTGGISQAMLGMSVIMVLAGGPAALFLAWMVKDRVRT